MRSAGRAQLEGVDVSVNVEVHHAPAGLRHTVQHFGSELHEAKSGPRVLDPRF